MAGNYAERPPTTPSSDLTWQVAGRIVLKVVLLFGLLNLLFAALNPMDLLGSISLYNSILPGRERLPYGEVPDRSFNLSLNNIPAMLASHEIAGASDQDVYSVLVIGDSGTWGWLLENEDTLAGQINSLGLMTSDGRQVIAYNLGYPIMALSKDLLLLDAAMEYDPDLVLWPVTLQSFEPSDQLAPPLVQENGDRMRTLIERTQLDLDPTDPGLVGRSFWERTIIGHRRPLADLLRLQLYGFSWAATGIDQEFPEEIPLRKSDFEDDPSWGEYEAPFNLTPSNLSLDLIEAGYALVGEMPLVVVNEPIFISDGENSDIRYNAWYPRWAYDQYRQLLQVRAADQGWAYIDLWDAIEPAEFTDSPVHLTPDGVGQLTRFLTPMIERMLAPVD